MHAFEHALEHAHTAIGNAGFDLLQMNDLAIHVGDDEVLLNMKRGYTQQEYRDLVAKIRERIPDCSIATDIIVGFPGETDGQFMETYRVLSDLKLDVAHLARYSSREGTVATRRMIDNVTDEEKMRRFRLLEELQEEIVAEINKNRRTCNLSSAVRTFVFTQLSGVNQNGHVSNSARFRARAEECRTLADGFEDRDTRMIMLRIAADYERMADRMDRRENSPFEALGTSGILAVVDELIE